MRSFLKSCDLKDSVAKIKKNVCVDIRPRFSITEQ